MSKFEALREALDECVPTLEAASRRILGAPSGSTISSQDLAIVTLGTVVRFILEREEMRSNEGAARLI